jgi:glycosyltransferase involved in cell wall biosynthesis
MKIVHIVVGKVNPDSLNGVSKVVHWMATSQTRLGHEVEVWGLVSSTTPSTRHREYELRLFQMTRLRLNLGSELKVAIDGLEQGTWVHFHSVFAPEFPSIAQRLKKRGLSYGITPHGGYDPGIFNKNPWRKRLYFAIREAGYMRTAKWIQAIGAAEIGDIRRIAPETRVDLIPNCQELFPFRVVKASANAARPLIGYSGRLVVQQKGLDYLIKGFAAYKARGGTGELWLIGDGEDRIYLEKLAVESGAQAYVSFLGAKHGPEKLDLVASLDAFIHCSRWDVIPTACLEAASLGRPLLVSRETNLAGYVEQNGAGLVLDETSAAGVARVLERIQPLYESKELQQMGENARALIEKEFRWEENARRFVAAINAADSSIQ